MIHDHNPSKGTQDIACVSFEEIVHSPSSLADLNFFFTIGGDGSVAWLVGAFHKAFEQLPNVPIVPVVRPKSVGFLKQLDLSPQEEFHKGFSSLLRGNYEVNHRTVLQCPINGRPTVAVNEMVLHSSPHLAQFTVTLCGNGGRKKGDVVAEILADGLMVVTAMGSTAWALSHHGLLNVNEEALELVFIGATHRAANYIIPRSDQIHVKVEIKNPVTTKDTVFAYNEARENFGLPPDEHSWQTLNLVYGPRVLTDGKVVGFGLTDYIIDPSGSIPFVSIKRQSVFEKARKFTRNTEAPF